MVNAQEWLDQKYPTKESKAALTKLEISEQEWKKLEGELDFTSYPNLLNFNLLIVSGKRERNWQSFYDWLNTNIVDFNEKGEGKGNIKAAKRSEHPLLVSSAWACIGHLMNGLERNLKIAPLDYTANNYHNLHTSALLPYEDNKTFFQLASGAGDEFKCGLNFSISGNKNVITVYEKLLKEWRDATINQTIVTTTLSIKIPTNLTKVTELETENARLKTENKDQKEQIENLWSEITSQQVQLPKGNN